MTYAKLYLNQEDTIAKRQRLRALLTKFEYMMWQELRRRKLGFKFRRQFNIGKYIVDFYCHELRLIIEIDGDVHDDQKEYDAYRDEWLEKQGCMVVRFTNEQVLNERD